MHWTGDGRIQVSRNFALGVAAVIIALALAAMFLIGMVIGQDGEEKAQAEIGPTPSVMAAEQETETATETALAASQQPANRRKRRRRGDPRPARKQNTPPACSGPTGPFSWTWKAPGSPRGPTTGTTVRCGT